MLKKYITTILLIYASSLFANSVVKKLSVYDCMKNQYSNCGSECKKIEPKIEFLIDKKDNSVMRKIYLDEIVDSMVLKNCKIFDDRNWDCSSKSEIVTNDKILITNLVNKMVDGIYQSKTFSEIFDKKMTTSVSSSICAK